MPIGKDEWNAGRKWETIEARILAFLRNNPEEGFTAGDIYHRLGYRTKSGILGVLGGVAMISSIEEALKTLVKEGSVKAKIVKETIGEETYYMIA